MNTRGPTYGIDPREAEWVRGLLGTFGSISGTVPPIYDRYIRVLHPLDEGDLPPWATVAESLGTVIHPTVQWHRLVQSQDADNATYSANPALQPRRGSLPRETLEQLLVILAVNTETPDNCRFGTWAGYGWQSPGEKYLQLPHREYVLGRGAIGCALHNSDEASLTFQSPNLIWPTDRAWFVATEVDFDSTVVAGTDKLSASLLAHPTLECLIVDVDDSLQSDADKIN